MHKVDYHLVESAITNIVTQHQKPTLDKIKHHLQIEDESFNQIIEYYFHLWEKRQVNTKLNTIDATHTTEPHEDNIATYAAQLKESLAMMRATLEATEDCLLMADEKGKIIGFNQKFVRMFNLPEQVLSSRDEVEGLNYIFGQLADPQELFKLLEKKYQDHVPGPCGEMLFKDGRIVERYYQPQIVNNKVVGHVWSLRDVTEKRKQEESLRLTNRAITASTHGVILLANNADYTITYLNPASLQLLSLEEENTIQKPFLESIAAFSEHKNKFLEIFQSSSRGSLTLQYPVKNKILWFEISIDPVYEKDQKNISHFVSIINDITKNKELENILQYKALHDALTGLPNKAYLEDAIRYRIRKAMHGHEKFGLLFVDIDRFKNINDTLGHGVGDKLLCLFGKRLQNNVQKKDVIARIGGDEFIILVDAVSGSDALKGVAKRLLEECRKKFIYGDNEFNVSASIGIVQFPEGGHDVETLIRNADIAMYQAKFSGRNQSHFYTNELNHAMSRRVTIENELHNAIKNGELTLFYQPIFVVESQKFYKVESLLRWKSKKLGSVSPAEFIPIAEDIGLMTTIGRWVLEAAIQQQCEWEKNGGHELIVGINISAKQLLDEGFVQHIHQTLSKNNVAPQKMFIEITESFFLLEEKIFEKLENLHNIGLKIAIDDFGTGYSNLNYLNKLNISYLKIDKSFVDQIDMNPSNRSVLLAIISIAKRLKFKIIAEGVETKNQFDFLKNHGCDEIQGYYFSKPLSILDLEKFLSAQKND